ncbi:MAG: restriction endonuclease subunit S [Paludibacteraceae bacterium]|nr:restriction endonuclease subunit S [Paludibacteraceae bacterium]
MGSKLASKKSNGGRLGKIDAPLGEKLQAVKWGEYRLGDLFDIKNTLSFNSDRLVDGTEYDYITRTSLNQGILQTTGFVNSENINPAGTWSLGLLQMDFFYRNKPWYAGQFVRMVVPKIDIPPKAILFFQTLLNRQKPILLQVLVRHVDETFRNTNVFLPQTANNEIDFDFMESFIRELEEERVRELQSYLAVTGLSDYTLTKVEQDALVGFDALEWQEFRYDKIFNHIEQGRRLKKDDQMAGEIPFVMSGVTNTGVVNYISNPVASFPANSLTVDIFGNTFYRSFAYGLGDDTGAYWNDEKEYSKEQMLFFATSVGKSLSGKYSYGHKLRSSQSLGFKMRLPTRDGAPDYEAMQNFISAVQKLVIKDVVKYADRKIAATKSVVWSSIEQI